jgi:Uma2 family endonuclease
MQIVPRVPLDHPATYDDLIAQPDHVVSEILDGELHTSPRPAPRHALAAMRLAGVLFQGFDRGGPDRGDWLLLAEPELHLGPDVLVPDIAGWRHARLPRLPETAFFPTVPDWICEVLSPSTVQIDRAKKLRIYAREGVHHAWLVDPVTQTLEVMRLDHGAWALVAVHAGTEIARAEPFEALELDLARLWDER